MASGDLTIELDKKDFDKLMNKLDGLSEVDQQAAIKTSMKKAMTIVAEQGKTNLQHTILHPSASTGKLMKSIGVNTKKSTKRNPAKGYASFKRPGGNAAHLVDRGTAPRYTKKGQYRGTVQKSRPYSGSGFWTKAVEEKGGEAINTLMNTIESSMKKY